MLVTVDEVLKARTAISCMKIKGATPYYTLRQLHKVRDQLIVESRIASDAEQELADKYNGKLNDMGEIVFPNTVDKNMFVSEWEEVLKKQINIEVESADVSAIIENVTFVNPDVDLDALEKFVIFESGEK